MNALFHRLSSQIASHWQETWFMKRMMHAGSGEKGRLEKECRNHPNQYTTYCNKCKIKTKYKVVHNSDTADYEKPMGQLTIDVRSHFFSNGKKEGNMQPWPLACFEVPRRSATSCLREISSQTAPATIWSHQWLGSKEPACRSCMSEFSRARKWMMMMNWCPLSRGYEKTKVERLRGELLSLTDFGVEGTLEEREAKVEQVFTMLWKENIQLRSLPACHPSSSTPHHVEHQH